MNEGAALKREGGGWISDMLEIEPTWLEYGLVRREIRRGFR